MKQPPTWQGEAEGRMPRWPRWVFKHRVDDQNKLVGQKGCFLISLAFFPAQLSCGSLKKKTTAARGTVMANSAGRSRRWTQVVVLAASQIKSCCLKRCRIAMYPDVQVDDLWDAHPKAWFKQTFSHRSLSWLYILDHYSIIITRACLTLTSFLQNSYFRHHNLSFPSSS